MLALVAILVAAMLAAAGLRLIFSQPTPRWQRWVWSVCRSAFDRIRRRAPSEPDPFEVLRLQTQLGRLATELRVLEADPTAYAKVHRLVALRAAYDDLLADACELAKIPVEQDPGTGGDLRWRAEQLLTEHGWSW